MTAAVAVIGTGPGAAALRERITRSPLAIRIVGAPEGAALVIREGPPAPRSYLGLADAARPDEFVLHDARAVGYLADLIEHFVVSAATSVAVRRPIQAEWARIGSDRRQRRRLRHFRESDYDWVGPESIEEGVFSGEGVLTGDDAPLRVRLRLLGHVDPLDGHYHWGGTAFGPQVRDWKQRRISWVEVSIDGREPVPARLTEITPLGDVRIVGEGAPPYALEPLLV
ncbi:DUF4873 domain-containing protein [Gordonia rhizosphera]|uniref:DUF4873 domain-containing protein n=1 Tax=Gordonia rhizosphera NBRC 16068 TaxID=1108045 RepID=K6WJ88_9ACTN|nr:DUF4873 domain-containing protein [Gordonia rhizosphera]GAB92232.1 hypothetical protein GORHZ_168_00300 [Gordonia rhizosphera NBRC 16068]